MIDDKLMKEMETKLIEGGYDGLYCPGECACHKDELVPCGMDDRDDSEEYVNGCSPGYQFHDPKHPELWCIKGENVEPTDEEWQPIRVNCL